METPTKILISLDVTELLKDILNSLPEYSLSLKCTKWNYKESTFAFRDYEDGVDYFVDLPMFVKGLEKYMQWRLDGCANGTMSFSVESLFDAGNYDANEVDCIIQFAIFNEVIYG